MGIVVIGKIVGVGRIDRLTAEIRQVKRGLFPTALLPCIGVKVTQVVGFLPGKMDSSAKFRYDLAAQSV